MRRKAFVFAGDGRFGSGGSRIAGLCEGSAGQFRRVLLQPERQRQLRDHNHEGQIENAFETEFFHERAADEKRQRIGPRPDDVVGADGARQAFGVSPSLTSASIVGHRKHMPT